MHDSRTARAVALTLIFTLLLVVPLSAGDWTRFRGPNGSGVAPGDQLPVEIGPTKSVVWEADVPFGRSSPVLTDDRIFLTAIEGDDLLTVAVDRDSGEILWKAALERGHVATLHVQTDSSTSTPVTDGENVYAFFHEAGAVSYDGEGNVRWQLPMGPFRNFYGVGASPILAGDTLLLLCDQQQGSFLLALDKDSGEELWRQERPGRVESYSTPVLYPNADEPSLVIVLGTKWIDAYDIDSGESVWTKAGVGAGPVSSPVLVGDLLFVNAPDHASEPLPPFETLVVEHDADGDGEITHAETEGAWMYNHFGFVDVDADGMLTADDWSELGELMQSDHWGLFGLRLPGNGDPPETLWNVRQAVAYIPTVLVYDDVLYMSKGSIMTSFDPETGEVLKRARLEGVSKDVYASLVAGDGKIYVGSIDGTMAVLSAAPEWEVLAVNELEDQLFASPAIAGDRLYVRTRNKLYSFGATDDQADMSDPTSGGSGDPPLRPLAAD